MIMDTGKQNHNITVHITKNSKNIKIQPSTLRKLVGDVCSRFNLSNATISIAIVDNAEIRKINKKFLNRNRITDCISFDLSDCKNKSFELVVNGEKALEQAKSRGHSSQAELALYIIHSLLHNLGFDDSKISQAKKMRDTENEILRQHGYGPVYNKNPA